MQKLALTISVCFLLVHCADANLRGLSGNTKKDSDETAGASDSSSTNTVQNADNPNPSGEVKTASTPSVLLLKRICGVNLAPWQGQQYLESVGGALIKLKNMETNKVTFLGESEPAKIKQEILTQGQVSIDMPAGKYVIDICNPGSSACKSEGKFGDYSGSFLTIENPQISLPMLAEGQKRYMQIWVKKEWKGKGPECDESTPLIISFNGEAVALSSPVNGVKFDIDADGEKDAISWPTNSQSMFLVLDRNGNGKIDNATELFGDHTPGAKDQSFENGFTALADYDSNGDSRINAKDAVFSKLKLWSDKNRDGISQANELFSLNQMKVESITVSYEDTLLQDYWGNAIRQQSIVELTDDTIRPIFDVYFVKDAFLALR